MGQAATQTTLLNKKVSLLQPESGFRAGLDTVMVASACPARSGDYVLDAGCGAGGALLCLMARIPSLKACAVDISPEFIALATQNMADNGWAEDVTCLTDNVLTMEDDKRFDHILTNPPYMEEGKHFISDNPMKTHAIGYVEEGASLEGWLKAAHRLLKSKGSLTLIQRADMLDKIILALGKRFGATEIFPLVPKEGEPAKRVVIRTWKDKHSPLILHSPLVIHEKDGTYTSHANAILKDGQSIEEGFNAKKSQR